MAESSGEPRVRVAVIADSPAACDEVVACLTADSSFSVVGTAPLGAESVAMVRARKPDLVLLHVAWPEGAALATGEAIMAEAPTPILALTAPPLDPAALLPRLLSLGVLDVAAVPRGPAAAGEWRQLTAMARLLAQVRVIRHIRGRRLTSPCASNGIDVPGRGLPAGPLRKGDAAPGISSTRTPSPGGVAAGRLEVVGIVSSTGGPLALQQVLAELPSDFSAAVLVVQHIAAGFSAGLCRWLSTTCALPVRLGQNGELVRPGLVLVAPDDVHLVVSANRRLRLDPGPPVHHLRPCGDLLLSSLATVYGAAAVAVVLTGMGHDGQEGATAVHAAGGRVLVQDEASSTVFGMPRAVIEAAVADETLSPPALGARLRALAARR